jgi:voltage-gated potassium channel
MTIAHIPLRLVFSQKKARTLLYIRLRAAGARLYRAYSRHFDIVAAGAQLIGFLAMMSTLVYLNQAPVNEKINTFLDALYFTVTTLTTTGFGDITPVGDMGKGLLVATMLVGIGLFLRLVNRMPKKNYTSCRRCFYPRHDMDAAHCKRCGTALNQSQCHEE